MLQNHQIRLLQISLIYIRQKMEMKKEMDSKQDLNDNIQKNVRNNQELGQNIQLNQIYIGKDQKNQNKQATGTQQSTKFKLTRKKKIIIGAIIIAIILALGLGLGLGLRKTATLTQISKPMIVSLTNNQGYGVAEYELKQGTFFKQQTKIKMLITSAQFELPNQKNQAQKRVLQQQQQQQSITTDYRVHVDVPDAGLIITLTSNNQVGLLIDPNTFIEYAIKTEPQIQRILQEAPLDQDPQLTVQQANQQLGKIFSQQFQTTSFEFKQTPMVQLNFDSQSNTFKLNQDLKSNDSNNQNSTNSKRMLSDRRVLISLKKMVKPLKKAVQKVAKAAVEPIRKNGALIGSVVGFVAGGLICGPGCAMLGKTIGGGVGLAAQTFVQACVPKDTKKVHCTAEAAKKAAINAGKSGALALAGWGCDKTICNNLIQNKTKGVARFLFKKK